MAYTKRYGSKRNAFSTKRKRGTVGEFNHALLLNSYTPSEQRAMQDSRDSTKGKSHGRRQKPTSTQKEKPGDDIMPKKISNQVKCEGRLLVKPSPKTNALWLELIEKLKNGGSLVTREDFDRHAINAEKTAERSSRAIFLAKTYHVM